jgi:DNA-binding MarR family transcriptional regulator
LENTTLDNIIDSLFYILPLIHKKLLKIDPPAISCGCNLSRLHVPVMIIVSEENTLPISEIAQKLFTSRPQMTLLINQLVSAGMVERKPNRADRRVSEITLTAKGRTTVSQLVEILKNSVRKKLSYLSEGELEELSRLLIKLRKIGARLDDHGH